MSDVFFTSDTHFGHERCAVSFRSFSSLEDMDELLIHNWNSVVKKSDLVYHLGDFGFKNIAEYRKRLNGNINLILGNHDNPNHCKLANFCSINQTKEIKIDGMFFFLSHYSHRVWNRSHYNSAHLFGHSHGRLPAYGKSFDVGVDSHNYAPLSFEQVKAILNELPDNHDRIVK